MGVTPAMRETARPPELLDAVPAPEGAECELWSPEDGEVTPCDAAADVLFVYEGSTRIDDRKNALGCAECVPFDIDIDDLDAEGDAR